jgi:hypothetical protein
MKSCLCGHIGFGKLPLSWALPVYTVNADGIVGKHTPEACSFGKGVAEDLIRECGELRAKVDAVSAALARGARR